VPRLPFQTFQGLRLPLPEMISTRLRDAHDCFLGADYEVLSELPPEGDLVLVVRRARRDEALGAISERRGRTVLVIAPSDAALRPRTLRRAGGRPEGLVALFTTNAEAEEDWVAGVPLGVRTDKARMVAFVRGLAGELPRDGLAYASFATNPEKYRSAGDAPHLRDRLAAQLEGADWVSRDTFAGKREGAEAALAYYRQMARHRFVFSPPGSGYDCYRHWEALYLGAIPIVQRSAAMERFAELPILFTDDYSEITEDYLRSRWEEMAAASFEIGPLLKSSWRTRFLDAVGQLRAPRFVYLKEADGSDERFQRVLRRSIRSDRPGELDELPTPTVVHPASLESERPWGVAGVTVAPGEEGLEIAAGPAGESVLQQRFLAMPGTTLKLRCALDLPEPIEECAVSIRNSSSRWELAGSSVDSAGVTEVELSVPVREDFLVLRIAVGDPRRGRKATIRDLRARLAF
jgi:hypothetical protein